MANAAAALSRVTSTRFLSRFLRLRLIPELLHLEARGDRPQVVYDQVGAVQYWRFAGGKVNGPPGHFHHGDKLERLDAPYTL